MKKVFVFLGDYYHSHDLFLSFVKQILNALPYDVQLYDYPIQEVEKGLEVNPDLVILALENRLTPEKKIVDTWLTNHLDYKITQYVANGGAWLALHSGMSCYPNDSRYIDMLKGRFVSHPEETIVTYVVQSIESFSFRDEHYFTEVREEETDVFMRSFSEYGESFAAWKHSYGKGRVLCYTPCHTEEGLKNNKNKQILIDKIRWCLNNR